MKRHHDPCVGIFWLVGRRLIAFTTLTSAVPSMSGYRDYPRGHDEAWHEVQLLIPELHDHEYFYCPRGRVLWVEANSCYRVLGPSALMARHRVVAQIVRRFGLRGSEVTMMADAHYDPACDADFED